MASFTNQDDTYSLCKYLYFNLTGSIFHKLEFSNTWIYTVNKENIVITCGDDEKTDTIFLNGTGKLSIREDCKGYASQHILQPVSTIHTTNLVDIIPEIKIKDLGKITIDGASLNFSVNQIKSVEKLQDLNKLSNSLDDINRAIDLQIIKNSMHVFHRKNDYMSYVIYVLIIIFVIFVIYVCIMKHCNNKHQPLDNDLQPDFRSGSIHFDNFRVTQV